MITERVRGEENLIGNYGKSWNWHQSVVALQVAATLNTMTWSRNESGTGMEIYGKDTSRAA